MTRKALLTILLGGTIAFPVGAFAADNVVLKQFGKGTGQNAVGLVEGGEDTELAGPQALYAGEGGELYLLDQVNGRVLHFNAKKASVPVRALEMPKQMQPTDIVVRKDEIFVWDGDIRALRPTGRDDAPTRGLQEYETRATEDEFTIAAFSQMGSQKPADDGEELIQESTRALPSGPSLKPSKQSLLSRGGGPVVASLMPEKSGSAVDVEVHGQGSTTAFAKFRLKVGDRLGTVEFLEIDNKGRMFVLAENIPTGGGEMPAAFVARYSPMGSLEGIFELPLAQSVALSRRFVTVSEEGDVFFLRTRQSAVDVLGVGFRPLRNAKTIYVQGARPAGWTPPAELGKGARAAVRPLNRTQVVQTAFQFERARWRLTPALYGKDPDTLCSGFGGRVRRPGYLHGKLGQEVRGIPYCWGCHGSLQQIGAKFGSGALAGNICTRNDPRRDTAGVDCSAFVSATWGLASHFTTMAIPSISKPLSNPMDLLPGDAFNKPGAHVMLFLRFTPDRKVEVMEASPGACNGKVCRNVYPLSSLMARGYTPVRFRGLVADMTARVDVPAEAPEKPGKPGKSNKPSSPGVREVPSEDGVRSNPRRQR